MKYMICIDSKSIFSLSVVCFLFLSISLITLTATSDDFEQMELPIISEKFSELITEAYDQGKYRRPDNKRIPRNMFVAFREIPPIDKLYWHTKEMVNNATQSNWTVHFVDRYLRDSFMKHYYKGTSLLWAYGLIHEICQVAATDIWRYAALYAFGGFYIDDDSYLARPIESIVYSNDSLILATEGINYEECYRSDYHLSSTYQMNLHNFYNLSSYLRLFHGKSIVQYALFVNPRNQIFYKLLQNIVELIKKEFIRNSMVLSNLHPHTKLVCVTGPSVLAATLREIYLAIDIKNKSDHDYYLRLVSTNFEEYGGKFHIEGFRAYSRQQRNYQGSYESLRGNQGRKIQLLSRYA